MALESLLKNQFKFSDVHAQRLSDLWFRQRLTLTVEQKDQIGVAYLKHYIGVDGQTIALFRKGEPGAIIKVGKRHGGLVRMKQDYAAFWREVAEITPDTYTAEDIEWLAEKEDGAGIGHMLYQVNPVLEETSPLIHGIHMNAHVYK